MYRRIVPTLLVMFALLAGIESQPLAAPKDAQPGPNVLLVVVDDLGTRLGCYGNPAVRSPNVDALARRGTRFDRAYCQYPFCNPSRTSFLSGRRPETTRIFDNCTPPRATIGGLTFWPEHFRQNGYFTVRVGKVAHQRFEDTVMWDVSEDFETSGGGGTRCAKDGNGPMRWRATKRGDAQEPDGRVARRVVQLLEQNKDKKFFVAAGFRKPHLPLVAPKRYFDMYPHESIALPSVVAGDLADVPEIAITRNRKNDALTDTEKRRAIAAYYACTTFVDAQIGLILDALDRLELADDTIVVFFGDHGFHLGEHGLWGKNTMFEESTRIPLIISIPGKAAGAVASQFVEAVDLYPTLSDLCGLPAPQGTEGTSFAPLFDDPGRAWKTAVFANVFRPASTLGRSVRTARYRYTEWGSVGAAELYDLETDPGETTNLAADFAHAPIRAELQNVLRAGWVAAVPSMAEREGRDE
jgi:iduronate 2-sulfatase